jgi:hypothetical protein
MTEWQYRVASRCVPGSRSLLFYTDRAIEQGKTFTNDWNEYNKYSNIAACKGVITKLKKHGIYKDEVEWAIQRREIEPKDWETV